MRAWRCEAGSVGEGAEDRQPTLVLTCGYQDGLLTCTNMAGDVVGSFAVPKGQEVFGSWLGAAVAKSSLAARGPVCLVKADGELLWRGKGKHNNLPTADRKGVPIRQGQRPSGRLRFQEGHDDRGGEDFAEYYTPWIRPYTHEERWQDGHDDRDGWTCRHHAPSVRPVSDPVGFHRV